MRSNWAVLRVLPGGARAVDGLKLTLSADETVTPLGADGRGAGRSVGGVTPTPATPTP